VAVITVDHAAALPDLHAAQHARHGLHHGDRLWPEKNCYVDLWIEILHARGLNPLALLPFTVAVDFEDDQWTFFKPSHDEILRLYGIKVHELTVWKPLVEHVTTHLRAGRLVSIEVDAFWLPDTQGTDYQHKHSKTTIAINRVDLANQRLGYFHNAGYFEAEGVDVQHLLHLTPAEPTLPLFAELISFDAGPVCPPDQLKQASLQTMRRQLAYLPASNPVERFATRFAAELPELQSKGLSHYHAWAFAGIRQWGAACELTAAWLTWMGDSLPPDSNSVAASFTQMSQDAKTLILKGARAVMSTKPFDPVAQLQGPVSQWAPTMAALQQLVSSAR